MVVPGHNKQPPERFEVKRRCGYFVMPLGKDNRKRLRVYSAPLVATLNLISVADIIHEMLLQSKILGSLLWGLQLNLHTSERHHLLILQPVGFQHTSGAIMALNLSHIKFRIGSNSKG